MWRPSVKFFMAMLQRRCPIVLLCLFCVSVVVYVFGEMSHQGYAPHASAQVIATQSVEDTVPLIDGYWDLMWKDSTKQLLRVQICNRQNGTRLVIHSEGSESIRMKKNGSTSRLINPNQISFTLRLKRTGEMVFTGKLQNGIICGTTNTGLPWMAIRRLD